MEQSKAISSVVKLAIILTTQSRTQQAKLPLSQLDGTISFLGQQVSLQSKVKSSHSKPKLALSWRYKKIGLQIYCYLVLHQH